MKERPILFTPETVAAILAGRKTQTRRVITPQPDSVIGGIPYWFIGGYRRASPFRCPYGHAGDRLWARETWRIWDFPKGGFQAYSDDELCPDVISESISRAMPENQEWLQSRHIQYRADGADDDLPWRPSIFMPRWASRITLEITDVRVQRVQDISEEDAIAEGCGRGWYLRDTLDGEETVPTDYRFGFKTLWDSINGKRAGCSWEANPWVWAISFRQVEVQR